MAGLLWRNNIEHFICWLEQRKKPEKVNGRTIKTYCIGKHRVFNPCGPRDQLNNNSCVNRRVALAFAAGAPRRLSTEFSKSST